MSSSEQKEGGKGCFFTDVGDPKPFTVSRACPFGTEVSESESDGDNDNEDFPMEIMSESYRKSRRSRASRPDGGSSRGSEPSRSSRPDCGSESDSSALTEDSGFVRTRKDFGPRSKERDKSPPGDHAIRFPNALYSDHT